MKAILIAAIGAGLFAGAPLTAAAQSKGVAFAEVVESLSVSLRDLDLKSVTGAREALARIQAAADHVCGDRPAILPLGPQAMFARCRLAAVDAAVSRLGSPLVTALATPRLPIRLAAH